MAIYQIIYRSAATRHLDSQELERLVDQAARYNEIQGITGILFFADQQILQVLEGPQAVVENLYHRIGQDPRHDNLSTLFDGPAPLRTFPDWAMGFSRLESGAFTRLTAYLDPQYWKDLLPRNYNAREVILDLLHEYAEGHLFFCPSGPTHGLRLERLAATTRRQLPKG